MPREIVTLQVGQCGNQSKSCGIAVFVLLLDATNLLIVLLTLLMTMFCFVFFFPHMQLAVSFGSVYALNMESIGLLWWLWL